MNFSKQFISTLDTLNEIDLKEVEKLITDLINIKKERKVILYRCRR